jgi:PKD repeat protein
MSQTAKPTFSVTYANGNIAPCEVTFVSTPQAPDEEIWRFDFKDGILYECAYSERVVRHVYRVAGIYGVTAIAVDKKTASDPVTVTINIQNPDPVEDLPWFVRLWCWFVKLFE